jgi:hypothetical protein
MKTDFLNGKNTLSMIHFTQNHYAKARPFASFLSGVSGELGIPMWVFYVNRGQAIASFGLRDKNGMIMEFYPGNLSYAYTAQSGFRTFIKIKGQVHEFFKETNEASLTVYAHELVLQETNTNLGLDVTVTYFTLPNAPMGALVRKVSIKNLTQEAREIEMVDGLTQLLPSGIDYGGYKAISNLLQSWMQADIKPHYAFYRLRASTADSSQVDAVHHGNYYATIGLNNAFYSVDTKQIFLEDTAFKTPYGFQQATVEVLKKQVQAQVNQVPCGFTVSKQTLKDTTTFYTLIGHAKDEQQLSLWIPTLTAENLAKKQQENEALHRRITAPIQTETARPLFDDYLQQCFLDNVLRGGMPLSFETKSGPVSYYVFSRKHGDLERDYNFFSLEPTYFSQGNGNFRDVLQNRRNDLFFFPEGNDVSIRQFTSLIQADGYNPLSVEGMLFTYQGKTTYPASLTQVLSKPCSPGMIAIAAEKDGLAIETTVRTILKDSTYEFKAVFGEGYWEDHFTYLYDLFETYESIYPDRMNTLLHETKVPFFTSPATIAKRSEKYVQLRDGHVRQYHAVHHDHHQPQFGWLMNGTQPIHVSIFAKLLTLVITKFSHLDPEGFGLSYEAEKPGWNDAMNGLPGLFGSGVSEAFELHKLVRYLLNHLPQHTTVTLLEPTTLLAQTLLKLVPTPSLFNYWDQRMDALETYRDQLKGSLTTAPISVQEIQSLLTMMKRFMDERFVVLQRQFDILPTYLTFEATGVEPRSTQPIHNDLKPVKVTSFKFNALPAFLESPARALSSLPLSEADKQTLVQRVNASELKDAKLGIYKTSLPLEKYSLEIGRIRAFTPGWLERESNFLHMTYKFLLGLLKSGMHQQFFEAIENNLTCFMNPEVYGRSPLENSSFIAPTNNPDAKKHGQGFFARLSGSTAEVLSIWRYLFFGPQLFSFDGKHLVFQPKMALPLSWFNPQGEAKTTLFNKTNVVYHRPASVKALSKLTVSHYELVKGTTKKIIQTSTVMGEDAIAIRAKLFDDVHIYMKEESP